MKKIIILAFILGSMPVFAERIPVKITPDQLISTCRNEIQVGDYIKFKTVGNGFLKEGTSIIGVVDLVDDNGWIADSAEIKFKEFKYRDGNKVITFESPLIINGFQTLKYKDNRKAQFFNYCGVVFRGKEIEILPEKDTLYFTIWLEQ